MRDFTLHLYRTLLENLIENGFQLMPNAPSGEDGPKRIILRHDIDAKPTQALAMARIEHAVHARSTYFFKIRKNIFNADLIRQITSNNHDIGYHYEDLVRNRGNYEKAISNFERNLDKLRKVFPVTTICSDGEPLSKYNNLWLWDKYDYRKYGISCEIYLDIDYNNYAYYTDTGRSWHGMKYNVWDHVRSTRIFPTYFTTFEMIDAIKTGSFPDHVLINIHPQRWNDDSIEWGRELILQNLKNMLKMGYISVVKGKAYKNQYIKS
jgi:hypothetical protein